MSVVPVPMFEEHRSEVIDRWGEAAWARSSNWWNGLSDFERKRFMQDGLDMRRNYSEAQAAKLSPAHETVQEIVERHLAWVTKSWGGVKPSHEQFAGLGEMYVQDPRFARNYGGTSGAAFVRDAILAWIEQDKNA